MTEGGRRQLGRNLLVVAQLAAALALLATAAVAVRSADALLDGPQGYDPRGVLAFDVTLSHARYSEPAEPARLRARARARLAELPGVESVGGHQRAARAATGTTRPIEVEGQPLAKGTDPPEVEARSATPALFATLRLPLLRGRGLEAARRRRTGGRWRWSAARSPQRFWPGEDPIGKRFRVVSDDADAPWLTVVGVSGDVIHQWLMRRN